MKKTLIYLGLLYFGTAGISAQQADSLWNLQQCIDRAIDYNLEVKRQELNVESASQDIRQSKIDLLPSLNGNVEHQLGTGRVLDRGTYTWVDASVSQGDVGLQSDLVLFEGLSGYHTMKMNRKLYEMNLESLNAMEDRLTLQVMTAYLTLLRNQELEEVARLNAEVTEKQVSRMEKLVEVGNESRGKLLEVRAQFSEAELGHTRARNNTEISRLNLMHIMNITDLGGGFRIAQPLLPDPGEVVLPEIDSVFQYALEHRPNIKSAKLGIEAQESYLAVRRSGRSPRLYARGLLYTNYSDGLSNPVDPSQDYPLMDQLTNNQYKQVALGISIPIFNGWQVQTNINKARIGLEDVKYQYGSVVLDLQQSVQQYYAEAVGANENYQSAKESVANSEEAYRFAEEKFNVGTGTALELQEARKVLYESTSAMISSRYALIFYSKIIDFYMGKPIEL